MKFQGILKTAFGAVFSIVFVFSGAASAQGQKQMPLVAGTNLNCAGYIQSNPISTDRKIVGAEDEQEQYNFAEGDNLYVNAGSGAGVRVGDRFAVVRPRGQVESAWADRSGIGFFVQELGIVEVVAVKSEVSVVKVTNSCNSILLGDLLQPVQQRTSPIVSQRPLLDRFAGPTGQVSGRIMMARDNRELLGREDIVYINLGGEDNVRTGDRFTIFRSLGEGNLIMIDKEAVKARDEGYQSDLYRGGKFSNQTARKRGNEARGPVERSYDAKQDRPSDLRKVVGELVVLNVKEKTATAIITRAVQEVHTGDRVEKQ